MKFLQKECLFMSKKLIRILSLIMSVILVLGLIAGALATVASAAAVTYQLVNLLSEGKIKPLGRTQASKAGDSITADWSGSGFDINVSGDGGTMTIGFKASYSAYWAVLVDGTQIWRGQTATSTAGSTFSVTIPAGKHTVRVVKETQMSNSETGYSYLTTLAFGGTIEKAPANKGLYIEFVGDSITCGDGALGEYEPGVKWLGAHDSATHSYAYYAAQKLGADYSLVARGGIGLFVGISEAEGTPQKKGIQDIYNYTSAYNPTSNGEYSFSRQPNVVFIELGANDSISSSDQYKTIAYWKSLMEDFIDQVRSKNPNAQIVLHSTNATKYKALMEIKEARKESDPKIHTFYYAYLGNGSAALDTQYAGHPDASDLERFGDALANFLKAQDIVPTGKSNPTYNDITYYVSENGNDSNDGKSIDTAKKTLNATVNQARTDNGTFAANSRVVVYVQGTVKGSSNNSQGLLTGGTLKDTNGKKVPVLITTYNYNGTKAVLNTGHAAINDGNGSIVFYNDATLKDIIFQSTTNPNTQYRDSNLYTGYGNTLVLDNVTFAMNGDTPKNTNGWRIAGGSAFGSDGLPAAGNGVCTVIFKNGDYTNLGLVAAVKDDNIWVSNTQNYYEVPNGDYRLIIEDGAKMGTVYNRHGVLTVGNSSVTINGGSVQQYIGTHNGAASNNRRTYKGDVNLTVNGGTIYGTHFSTVSAYVNLEGNINTTINGGIFEITPKDTSGQYDSYLFSGRAGCALQDVNTTINGGQFYLIFDVAADSAFYFGPSGGSTCRNVTNKISAGLFMPYSRGATGVDMCLYFGGHTGHITGTLRNEITGGNFQFGLAGASDRSINAGSRGVNLAIGKVENVFGKSGSTHGPNMSGAVVKLAGGWAQVGVSSKLSAQPTACSDTVVVSNTIYGGNYSTIYLGTTGNPNLEKGYYSFIKGSIENKIYGGFFQGNVFCAGNGTVFGHVKTDVYGGFFKTIYGGTESSSTVYDGVELNIRGMDEYYPVNPNDSWVFCGGNKSGKVPVPMTEGRPAIKFTIAPSKSNELILNTKLKVGETDGTKSVSVSGGVYPRGFAVSGTTVGGALASGYVAFDGATGKKASYASGDTSVGGYVVVDKNAESFTNELVYYVSEHGQDAYSGTSMATPKKTFRAVFSELKADNGNSFKFPAGTKVTIYVEGRVNNDAGTGSQNIGGGSILYMNDVHDHVPITVTTYNYNGSNKATIVDNHYAVNGGNASVSVVNDLYFKDIDLQSVTNPSTGYADTNLYAAGCALVFDNCSITTDGKATVGGNAWRLNADHYSTGGFNPINYPELYGSLTFKNGDYTNLERVAAVGANSIWRSAANGGSVYSTPGMHCRVIIEDGAKMGTVYNAYGTLAVGSATVEVRGGTVKNYYGTSGAGETAAKTYNTPKIELIVSGGNVDLVKGTGDSKLEVTYDATDKTKKTNVVARELTVNSELVTTISGGTVGAFEGSGFGGKDSYKNAEDKSVSVSSYVKINGNVTNTFSGGTIGGATFFPLNDYTQLTGNLTNTFSGAKLEINPTSTANGGHGIFMSGRSVVTINGNVTNNITAGSVGVLYKVTNIKSGIYLGLRDGWINGDLTNNISGGEIYTKAASEDIVPSYASMHFSAFSGGSVKGTMYNNISGGTFTGAKGAYYLGQQGVSGSIGKVVNVIGDQTTGTGPVFNDLPVYLGGGWGRLGVTNNSGTLPTTYTDTVVLSSTIYGGTFENYVYNGVNSTTGTNVTYIKGSVEANIYGGSFTAFCGSCKSPVYGHATTNIYGGSFNTVYGALSGQVYDGVELNIFGMTEGSEPTGIWAAGTTAKISTVTEGRDAVKLTIDPKTALTLSMPISAGSSDTGTVTGTTSALVTGGTYTNGFAVAGLKVKDVLATGLVPLKADGTVITVTADMTTTGTDSVTLVSAKWTEETAKLTLSDTTVPYNGKENAKIPTETVKFHNATLVKGTDYTVAYSRDGAATTDFNSLGTVTVTITAKAPYSGTFSTTYTIVRDSAIGNAIADVTERTAAYDVATVTADDSADLSDLKSDIKAILTDNASVLTEEEKTALNGLTTTVEALEKTISTATTDLNTMDHRISEYDVATVTADDATVLKMLGTALDRIKDSNLTAAQKARKQELKANLAALNAQIDDVAAMMADAKEELAKYTAATVTADHSAALTKLASDIAAIPNGNLTAAQKTEKQTMANQVAALQKVVSDTASELAAVKTEVAKFTSVSESDAEALNALAARIVAIPDGNLTAAQKSEKKAAADKVAALLKSIGDVTAELAAVTEEAGKVNAATATADDSAKLNALADRIAAISDDKLTTAQKAEKQAAANKVAAAQQAISQAKTKLDEAKAAADAISSKATADDSEALAAAAAKLAAVPAGNLTAAQKAQLDAANEKVTGLQKTIADIASTVDTAKESLKDYDAASVTADDNAALETMAAKLQALPAGNMTEQQKADAKAAADTIAALRKVVADTATNLAEAQDGLAKLDAATVTADDSAKLAAVKAQLTSVSDGNLTAAQKTAKQAAADKVAALEKVISDTAKALEEAKAEVDKFDPNTVNSENSEALAAAAAQLEALPENNMTAAQKAEKKAAAQAVTDMQKTLADTATDLAELKKAVEEYDPAAVTSADKEALTALKKALEEYPDDHLTTAEKAALEQQAADVQTMLDTIAKAEQVAGNIDAIAKLLEGKSAANVTSADQADLTAAQNAITELKKDASLSNADKQKLAALESKVGELNEQLKKADAADEVPAAVESVKPENVEPEDKAALQSAIEALEAAEKTYGTNYTAAEKQAIQNAKDQLTAALAIIEEVEAVQKQIAQLPATADPDDEAAIHGLEATLIQFDAMNDRQKSMITAAELDKLDKLAQSLRDYKIIKGDKAEWTQESNKDLTFTVNGLLGKFEGVQVDGSTVDSKYYTVKSGSTIITLSDEFLDKLAKGEHTITAVYTDGKTSGTFTVKAKSVSPNTGDNTNIALLSLLAVFSVASAAAVTIGMRKREQ